MKDLSIHRGDTIRFAITKPVATMFQPQGYKFGPPRGTRGIKARIARLMWRALMKMGVLQQYALMDRTVVYHHTASNARKIADVLNDGIMRTCAKGKPDPSKWCIVIGGPQFDELLASDETMCGSTKILTLELSRFYHQSDTPPYHASYHGFDVHVVPWLDGACVLPKVIIEKTIIR